MTDVQTAENLIQEISNRSGFERGLTFCVVIFWTDVTEVPRKNQGPRYFTLVLKSVIEAVRPNSQGHSSLFDLEVEGQGGPLWLPFVR